MSAIDWAKVKSASAAYPKPDTYKPDYGTSGFRDVGTKLVSTVFRCGVLTAARAIVTGQACGLMITASHNVETDNGVKIVDPSGEMLCSEWESYATRLAQANDDDAVVAAAKELLSHSSAAATVAGSLTVVVGRDTRPTGQQLLDAATAGIESLGVKTLDAGLVTTPQLHYYVMLFNGQKPVEEAAYLHTFTESHAQLVAGTEPLPGELLVDCANGIGARKLTQLVEPLAAAGLRLALRNTGDGRLNHECGADHVQKEQAFPAGLEGAGEGARCCSIDGDSDRVVFFTKEGGQFKLIDGDKIATLSAIFIRDLLKELPEEVTQGLKVGIVQTAYANGASTKYISGRLGLPTACTPTGVKYLHHVAKEFDVGVYFESNGHGTVLFSPQLQDKLRKLEGHAAAKQLLALSVLMNQAVGDAISGLLLVEIVLRRQKLTITEALHIYADLPSRQTKLKVADRTAITTADAERRVVSPAGLQQAIDELVAKYTDGRAFARPSGTEDAVRVYAEASTQEDANKLAQEVARAVYEKAGGVGGAP